MYTYKLKYYPGAIQGKGNDPATMIEHWIKPLVDGSLVREMQGYRKRIKFEGKISLVDNKKEGCNDYTLFKQIEALNAGKTIFIDIVGDGVNFTGYFYPFNCTVNDDNCTVELPELMPVDEYTIFDEYGDIKYNLIEEIPPYAQVNINEPVRMEYFECETQYFNEQVNYVGGCSIPYSSSTPLNMTPTVTGLPLHYAGNTPGNFNFFYGAFYIVAANCLYSVDCPYFYNVNYSTIKDLYRIVKNEITVNNIVDSSHIDLTVKTTWALEVQFTAYNPATGQAQPPAGSGWLFAENAIIHGVPHAKYIRIPFYDNQLYNYFIESQSCSQSYKYILSNPYSGGAYNSSMAYRGRPLVNVIQFFASKMGLNSTTSQFFYGTLNPITGIPNQYYTLHTVKDIAEPTAPDASPLMEMSWNDLITSLQALFPVDWVMKNGMLTIEHQKYFENGGSYTQDINLVTDVRGLQNIQTLRSQIVRTNKYTYDDGNIFNIESFHNAGFFNIEFKPVSILYGIFTKDKRENIRTTQFITDIGGVFSNTTQFPDDGICLIAAKNINGVWECESEIDYLTNLTIANGHLSSANIITTYWKDYRMFIRASFESTNIIFNSESNKKVQNILISDCNCVSLYTDNLIKTNLGVGKIISSRHNLLTKTTELTLLIGYAEN